MKQDGPAEASAEQALRTAGDDDTATRAALLLEGLALPRTDWARAVEAGACLAQRAPQAPRSLAALQGLLDAFSQDLALLKGKGKGQAEEGLMRDLLSDLWKLKLNTASLQVAASLCGFQPPAQAVPGAASLAQVDATKLAVGGVTQEVGIDPLRFPYLTRGSRGKQASPDGRRLVWREKVDGTYCLVISNADGSGRQVLTQCRNGFLPSWSPDGGRILYTAIDWRTMRRSIHIYDLKTGRASAIFKSRGGVGGLAAWSPDGSKVVFTYKHQLWIMNADGIGLALLNVGRKVSEAGAFAWSKDGTRLAYQPNGRPQVLVLRLAQKL